MKKITIMMNAIVFILIFCCHCQANSENDTMWQKRISGLKTRYAQKFTKVNNAIIYYELSKPYEKLGASCRFVDLSTSKKIKEFRLAVASKRKELAGGENIKGGQMVTLPWLFWPYKKFIKNHGKGIKNHLPDGVKRLIPDLLHACATYDYCKKQKKNENIMFVFPAEGVLGIKIPTGDYNEKTYFLYLFLVEDEDVSGLKQFL